MRHFSLGLAVMLLAIVEQAAGSFTVTTDVGTLHTTSALSGYATAGDDMVGMNVTAYFSDDFVETVNWSASGVDAGQAVGTGSAWSLSESGNTFATDGWSLTNSRSASMLQLVIDGKPGDTMFDVAIDSAGNVLPGQGGTASVFGTVGSASGWTFETSSDIDMTATYRNAVGLGANAPVGDLYTTLDLSFTNGLAGGNSIAFTGDTDNAETAGDITPSVPEPTTFIIWSVFAGIALAVGFRRR